MSHQITVDVVDNLLKQEVIVAFADDKDPYLKQLSYQPSSGCYTLWAFDPTLGTMITQRTTYVHTAVEWYNNAG